MTRVLITGARGFVGRHVTAALSSAGAEVHATTSGPVGAVAGVAAWHRADLLDAATSRRLVATVRPDALVHLAWCSKPPTYWRDLDNVRWTAASLELARAFADCGGTRLISAGTCAEYDWGAGYCDERTTPIAPTTLYGAAKAALGGLLEAFAREAGLSVVCARLFFLFGPYDSPARLIPTVITRLQAGRQARCAAASHVRDFLFVADAADALAALVQSPVTGAVNIGSGVPTRVGTLAAAVADRLGRRDLLQMDEGPMEDALVVARVARLRDEVGWAPRTDFDTALDQTVSWWKTQPPLGAIA